MSGRNRTLAKCSTYAAMRNAACMQACFATISRTPQERAGRAKELLAERVEKKSRVRILDAVRKKLPKRTFTVPDHRNGRCSTTSVARPRQSPPPLPCLWWEEKKTQGVVGRQNTVDYEAIAGKAVLENERAGRHHVSSSICALVSACIVPDSIRVSRSPRTRTLPDRSAIQNRSAENHCRSSRRTLEKRGKEGQRQAETQSANQTTLVPYQRGRVLGRGPFLIQASAAARRPRPVAIFWAMTMMGFRSGSAALLKHFWSL